MHPSEALYCAKSHDLEGKKIVLGITGSIAAVQSFELARELMRHGACVHVVMSQEAAKFITPLSMHFATGNEVTMELDGRTQHISFFGEYDGKADLLLISPCTANTISKIAMGIDDTPVTTMATVALGSKTPIIIVPAMNLAMYANPVIQKNVKLLEEMDVTFVGPDIVGKKAKNASSDEVVESIIVKLGRRDFIGKRVLIIGGATREKIDDVRVITNMSSGETALQFAVESMRRGAEVELWHAFMSVSVPDYIPSKKFESVNDLENIIGTDYYDVIIVPAALSDYGADNVSGKLSSDMDQLTITLKKLPKILPKLRKCAELLVGFKAETVGGKELISRAEKRLNEYGLDMIIANDMHDVSSGYTKTQIITRDKKISFEGSKADLARVALDQMLEYMK